MSEEFREGASMHPAVEAEKVIRKSAPSSAENTKKYVRVLKENPELLARVMAAYKEKNTREFSDTLLVACEQIDIEKNEEEK